MFVVLNKKKLHKKINIIEVHKAEVNRGYNNNFIAVYFPHLDMLVMPNLQAHQVTNITGF